MSSSINKTQTRLLLIINFLRLKEWGLMMDILDLAKNTSPIRKTQEDKSVKWNPKRQAQKTKYKRVSPKRMTCGSTRPRTDLGLARLMPKEYIINVGYYKHPLSLEERLDYTECYPKYYYGTSYINSYSLFCLGTPFELLKTLNLCFLRHFIIKSSSLLSFLTLYLSFYIHPLSILNLG